LPLFLTRIFKENMPPIRDIGIIVRGQNDISEICRVHSPTNALFYFKKHIKIYMKIHINIATTCFGLRPSWGSLQWTWLKLYLC